MLLLTTVGKLIFNEILPESFPILMNQQIQTLKKKHSEIFR